MCYGRGYFLIPTPASINQYKQRGENRGEFIYVTKPATNTNFEINDIEYFTRNVFKKLLIFWVFNQSKGKLIAKTPHQCFIVLSLKLISTNHI